MLLQYSCWFIFFHLPFFVGGRLAIRGEHPTSIAAAAPLPFGQPAPRGAKIAPQIPPIAPFSDRPDGLFVEAEMAPPIIKTPSKKSSRVSLRREKHRKGGVGNLALVFFSLMVLFFVFYAIAYSHGHHLGRRHTTNSTTTGNEELLSAD